MSEIVIRRAALGDAQELARIAFASKAHWGYDAAFMERVRLELAPSGEHIERWPYYLAQSGSQMAGFYGLIQRDGQAWLEDLWVAPPFIGTGLGRLLWDHLTMRAVQLGMLPFDFSSDPNAEGFYLHMGARRVGEVTAPSTGRRLPRMRFEGLGASLKKR